MSLSKNLLGFSTKSLAGHCACPTEIPLGDARCPLEADNEHTCVLYCILRRVHAPPQNRFNFICRKRGKLCEAFGARCWRDAAGCGIPPWPLRQKRIKKIEEMWRRKRRWVTPSGIPPCHFVTSPLSGGTFGSGHLCLPCKGRCRRPEPLTEGFPRLNAASFHSPLVTS